MGNNQSIAEENELPEKTIGEDERKDSFALWPGLEGQLEASFECLDIHEEGLLPFSTLEPVLRHHLMQIGLLEYVTRFATSDGILDHSYVAEYIERFQIDLSNPLDIIAWKNLMLCWITRVQDAQHEDIIQWQQNLAQLQEHQAREYKLALEKFQTHYINQIQAYYHGIDEVHKQEEAYRKEWENNLELQEQYYNSQIKYMQEQNDEAAREYQRQKDKQEQYKMEFLKNLKSKPQPGPDGILVRSYYYPTDLTRSGAPISGGAVIPIRRRHAQKV